jgi:drug/metabolite transporter (DMT)-like permease
VRGPVRRFDYLLLVVLAAMWGLSFVFYRIGAPLLGPTLFVEGRVAVAGATLVAYLVVARRGAPVWATLRARWRDFFILGALNAALPFSLFAYGELTVSASYASILNSLAPMFSVVLGAAFLRTPVSPLNVGGLALGILGVAVLVGAAPFALTGAALLAIGAIAIAALSYAVATLYVNRVFGAVPAVTLATGQQLTATVLLLPFALVTLPAATFNVTALEAVLGIAFLCTVLAHVMYFRLVHDAGPTQALTVTLLMPIFGVLWGWFLLHETVAWSMLVGVAMILSALGLVTRRTEARPATPTPPGAVPVAPTPSLSR